MLTTTFAEGRERTTALGVWSAVAVGGGAIGLLLGGVLTSLFSWQWIFFVNVPVGVIAILLALRFVPESRVENARGGVDIAGAVSVTGGTRGARVRARQRRRRRAGSRWRRSASEPSRSRCWPAFVMLETRLRHPLIRLGIFRMRSITGANAAMLLVAGGMFAMFFFASIYVQEVLGYSALRAGLAFLPVTAGIIAGAGLSQQLIRRVGVRAVGLTGMSIAAVGLILLSRIPVAGTYLGDLLPGLMIMSVGMGLTFVPITLIATTNVGAEDAGLASGLLNTSQQLGGAIGLAVLSTLAANTTSNTLSALGHAPDPGRRGDRAGLRLPRGVPGRSLPDAQRCGHPGGDGSAERRLADRQRQRGPDCRARDRRVDRELMPYAQRATGQMCAPRTRFPDMSSDTVDDDDSHAHSLSSHRHGSR